MNIKNTNAHSFFRLLTFHIDILSEKLDEWMHSDYERNPNHSEGLIHTGANGNPVRSKSESIIDMLIKYYFL